jgi:hypothetical protein
MKRYKSMLFQLVYATISLGIGWTWGLGISVPIGKILLIGILQAALLGVWMVAEEKVKQWEKKKSEVISE